MAVLFGFGHYLNGAFGFSIPPAIFGILVLFIFFVGFACVPNSVGEAGKPLLAHMSLFFIPAIVAIINFKAIIFSHPLALLLAIVFTTLVSLGVTAYIANRLMLMLMPQTSTNDLIRHNKDD